MAWDQKPANRAVAPANMIKERGKDIGSGSEVSEENPADFYPASTGASVAAALYSTLASRGRNESLQQLTKQQG
eukprot:7799943-Ditylum_brightwellii.AAC.1